MSIGRGGEGNGEQARGGERMRGEGRAGEGTGELASALRPHFLCLGSSVHVNIETGAPPTYLETCCVGGRKRNKTNKSSISRPGLPSLLASCSAKQPSTLESLGTRHGPAKRHALAVQKKGRGTEEGRVREGSRKREGCDGWWMRRGLWTKDHSKVLASAGWETLQCGP